MITTVDCEVEEPALPANGLDLSDNYETAGSGSSEAESESSQENVDEPGPYRTRSGRVSRPPERFGYS